MSESRAASEPALEVKASTDSTLESHRGLRQIEIDHFRFRVCLPDQSETDCTQVPSSSPTELAASLFIGVQVLHEMWCRLGGTTLLNYNLYDDGKVIVQVWRI